MMTSMSEIDEILAEFEAKTAPAAQVDLEKGQAPEPVLMDGQISEDALATIFERRHADRLRYCHTTGAWFVWTGSHWQRDTRQRAFNWAREVCREFAGLQPKFTRAAVAASVERFAQAAPALAVDAEIWDDKPWLLATPGGTVDLRTGELRQADPADHLTRVSAVTPEDRTPERWLRFLDDATRGDAEMIRFLQQMAGYCLTGSTKEHALFFAHGGGGNGKSVFINAISGMLGDYAKTAAMTTFTASKHDQHPADLAMLKGARLVTASETEKGRKWAEAKIKQMTGGDPITARFMRQDFFTYQPEFKILIVGNYAPDLENVDDATRRRFNILPFTNKPTEPDPNLEEKLREEWPAILNWAIQGCMDWQQNGLIKPAAVTAATQSYFAEQNLPAQWLEDCCELGEGYQDSNKALFASWRRYAEQAGEDAGSAKSFGGTMRKLGFQPFKSGGSRGFKGLRVKPDPAAYDPRDPGAWD
jgi:putative DNA primase/helicase